MYVNEAAYVKSYFYFRSDFYIIAFRLFVPFLSNLLIRLLPWCWGLRSMQHDEHISVFFVPLFQVTNHYLLASFWSRLGLGQLFPCNLLITWNLCNFWPNLGNSDFHALAPSMFRYPDVGARRSSSLFLASRFIAFQRMQNRELVFIWGWCVKSFHCIQHVLNSESVSGCTGRNFP